MIFLSWIVMWGFTIGVYFSDDRDEKMTKREVAAIDLVLLLLWPIVLGKEVGKRL